MALKQCASIAVQFSDNVKDSHSSVRSRHSMSLCYKCACAAMLQSTGPYPIRSVGIVILRPQKEVPWFVDVLFSPPASTVLRQAAQSACR